MSDHLDLNNNTESDDDWTVVSHTPIKAPQPPQSQTTSRKPFSFPKDSPPSHQKRSHRSKHDESPRDERRREKKNRKHHHEQAREDQSTDRNPNATMPITRASPQKVQHASRLPNVVSSKTREQPEPLVVQKRSSHLAASTSNPSHHTPPPQVRQKVKHIPSPKSRIKSKSKVLSSRIPPTSFIDRPRSNSLPQQQSPERHSRQSESPIRTPSFVLSPARTLLLSQTQFRTNPPTSSFFDDLETSSSDELLSTQIERILKGEKERQHFNRMISIMTPQKKENEKKKEIREEIDQILLELTNEFSGLEYSGSDSDEQGPIPQTPTCVQRDDTKPTPSKIRDSPVKSISFPLLDADTEPQTSPIIHPQISSADVDIVPLNKNSNKSHENEQQKRENRRISVQNRLERIKNALDSLSDEPAGKAEDKLTFQQESHVTHPIPPAFIPEQRFSPPIPSPPVTPSPTVPLQTVFRFGDQPPTFQSSRTLHPTSTPLRSLPTPSIPMSSRPPSLFTPKLIFDSPSPNDDLFITHRRSHTPSIDHDDSLSDDNQLDNTHHHTVNTLPLNRPPHNTFPTPSTFPPSAPIPVTPSPEPLPRPYLNTTPTTSRLFRAQETHKSPDPLRQVKTDRGGPGGWEESERLLGKSVHSLLSSQRHNTQQRELEREKEREEHLRRMKREEVESHHKEQEDETRPQNFEEEHDRASTREEEDEEKAETSPEDEEPSEREAKEEEEGEGENDEEEDIQEEEEGDPDEKREEEGDPGEEMEEEEENEELEPEDKFEEDENLSQQSSPIHHSPILFTPNTPPSFSRNHPHSPTTLSQSSPSILSTTTPHTQPLSRFAILKQKTEQLQNRLRQLGTDEDRPTTSKPRAERKSEEHWRVELRMLLEDRKKEREIREEDEEKRRFEEEQRQADNETRSELIRKERRELESQQHAMRQEVARTEKIEETIREESAEREKKGKALFKLQSPTTDAQMRLSQLMKSLR